MKKWYLVFILLLSLPGLYAQISDDFDRAELVGGEVDWNGDLDKFVINSQSELQLNDDQAGNATLFFSFQRDGQTQWDIYFRMEFNPSASNRLRIYLIAEDSLLSESDAFFLEIGENGNDVPIYLIQRTEGVETTLLAMETAAVAFDPAEARVRVKYDGEGNWVVYADYDGASLFPDRRTVDADPLTYDSGYFGLHCFYTVTRATLFYFDNLRIGEVLPDTTAPELIAIRPLAPNALELVFDKLLEEESALELSNYSIAGVGMPEDVFFDPGEANKVELFFEGEFENGRTYELSVEGLSDLNGNAVQVAEEFVFVLPEFPLSGDLVINEIHPLPSSTTLIPNIKYIELYNSSDKFLELEGTTFSDRSRSVTLPSYVLEPGEYLLLSESGDAGQLETYGPVLGLSNFPVINNNNDDIELRSAMGELLFAVSYRPDWFDDPLKAEGGYSLELINPEINCQTRINWALSERSSGGSPGQANSVLDGQFRPPLPELNFGSYSDEGHLGLHFNGELDRRIPLQSPDIEVVPGTLDFNLQFDPFNPTVLHLEFAEELNEGQTYTVSIGGLASCAGEINPLLQEYEFKVPGFPERGEVVINELLYHPPVGIRDFIEFKNTHESQFFRLSDLLIYHRRSSGAESTLRSDNDRLIPPGTLLTVGRETHLLQQAYTVEDPGGLQTLDLMALDVNSGSVVLSAFHPEELVYLDSIQYSGDLHDPLLRNTRGISLERTDPFLEPSFSAAWYSAATLVGGATPTAENSQRREVTVEEPEDFFFLNSRTFSPDGDGFEDFLQIEYRIDEPGYVANIRIFDMNGNLVRRLVQNQSLGTEGFLKWSGENDSGEKQTVGIYVILIELHHISGDRRNERLTAVLAERL